MTLNEAIQHLQETIADPTHQWGCEKCKAEHEQLLEWLEDYKQLKSDYIELDSRLRTANTENDELKRMLKNSLEALDAMAENVRDECGDAACGLCEYDSPLNEYGEMIYECEGVNGKTDCFKWRHHDEAMKLLGGADNAEIDLLPCPFCGKLDTAKCINVAECNCIDDPTEWDKTHYGVVCGYSIEGGCGASTGWNHSTPYEAAKEWNTRASGWISVSERIPDNSYHKGAECIKCMIMTKYGVTEGWYNPDFNIWFTLVWYTSTGFRRDYLDMKDGDEPRIALLEREWVSHWMPYPDAPKGGTK